VARLQWGPLVSDTFSDLTYSMAGIKRRNPFDSRRSFADKLLQSGADASPVAHPLQGAARLAQALVGGYLGNKADQDEEVATQKQQGLLAAAMSETDPQKRIALLGAADPSLGARLAGQTAVDQVKAKQQREGLQAGAGGFGASFGLPPSTQSASVPPLPQGQPNGSGFNNNVGNIRATPINWDGKGAPHNGFETFATPQHGVNAAFKNLGAYAQANPNITVAEAIAKWAPPNENDTGLYIRQLAESTGINPGMPLAEVLKDPAVAAQMLDAITRKEKGGLPQGVTADTFMTATGGQPPQQPGGLTINMTPQGIPQGDNPGMPPAPSPQGIPGPAVIAPPAVPDVPRPQPSPQQLQQYQARIASGEFGPDPTTAIPRARAALDAEIDRDWNVQRERAKMQFGQQSEQFKDDRKHANERDNPKFTEDANKAHAYALRISKALPLLEEMVTSPEGQPSMLDRGVTNLPLLGNTLAGPRGQRFDQLSRDMVNAILRRESGATITDQEFKNAYQQYIPQPGDKPETVQLKMENIRTQLKAFADTANRTPDVYGMQGNRGSTAAPQAVPAPATGTPTPGAVEGGYRFKGGNPADRNSWERVQ
jgi:hypothetical protein